MLNIKIIYTGGTIGMSPNVRGGFLPNDVVESRVLRLAPPDVECHFESLTPLIDSSCAQPSHWDILAKKIAALRDEFDGFVILHGTDTMAWTASALAFLLPNFGKPLILTGAMQSIAVVGSDAVDNVADALLAATFIHLTEVSVVFGRKLWRGCAVRKSSSTYFEAFSSPNAPPLVDFSPQLMWHAEYWRLTTGNFSARTLLPNLKIACLALAPGFTVMAVADILERQKLDGAILLTYGSGNVPEDPRFLRAVSTACERGSLVINVPQPWHSEVMPNAYTGSAVLSSLGVLSGGVMTPEAALTKLHVLLSLGKTMNAQISAWYEDWAGEGARAP